MFKASRHVIVAGNGYGVEWPVKAKKRGLQTCAKAKKLFKEMGFLSAAECDAKPEVMFDYNTALNVEVSTPVDMTNTGILPACAENMAGFSAMPRLAGERRAKYPAIKNRDGQAQGARGEEASRLAGRCHVFVRHCQASDGGRQSALWLTRLCVCWRAVSTRTRHTMSFNCSHQS